MNAVQDDTSKLADDLSKTSESTLAEIIRQAETYLDCQLTAAIAADQRATSFAAIMAGAIALLAGGAGALVSAKDESAWFVLAFIPCIALFSVAMLKAFQAAEPCDFAFSGNDPKGWVGDVKAEKPISRSLAEQAAHYSEAIASNDKTMLANSAALKQAMTYSKIGVWLAAAATLVAIVARFNA